jgi:hypothetical protein
MQRNSHAVQGLLALMPPEESRIADVVLLCLLVALIALVLVGAVLRDRFGRVLSAVWWIVTCSLAAILLFTCLLPGGAHVREAGPRAESREKMTLIAQAMHNYADNNGGRLPPAAVRDRRGRPLLSWRVLLLPYLEEDDLYRQFKLDEPWDSPHNAALLRRMPRGYAPPRGLAVRAEPFTTYYQVFVGKNTVFEGKEGLRWPDAFPGGTADTILLAEAGQPVPWTKPEDLPYQEGEPLPPLGGLFTGRGEGGLFGRNPGPGFHVALGDASVRFVTPAIKETTLRRFITRHVGDASGPK